ncbi:MAG: BrnT family toxin [Pyrinomonadaceae bacterium]
MKRSDAFDVEWDEGKNRLNQRKHAVSFEEAATIFLDPLEIAIDDPAHTISEYRFVSIGETFGGRLLVVSYSEHNKRIRIITARKPTRSERRAYEES